MKAESNEDTLTHPLSVFFSDKARASSEPCNITQKKTSDQLCYFYSAAGSFHRIFQPTQLHSQFTFQQLKF